MDSADTASAASHAIRIARSHSLAEAGPDELLLGCLLALSRFGIARLGPWTFDLEALGVEWLRTPEPGGPKVAWSDAAVELFDRAALIARQDGVTGIHVEHLLAAFTRCETGLMASLKKTFAIESATWRAAVAEVRTSPSSGPSPAPSPAGREYLTPEEAAETLGIHVQTIRGYIRSGKLPALRVAGERAIRIRRADLDKVLEPLVPDKPQS